jgi:anaerobic selenocysteine-containing dehydrogenase
MASFDEFWSGVLKYGFWYDPPYKFEDYSHEFQTKSGKFELRSKTLETKLAELAKKKAEKEGLAAEEAYEKLLSQLGISARGVEALLPHYEPPRFAGDSKQFPLTLVTYKTIMHAEGRGTNTPWAIAAYSPYARWGWKNWVEIHPEKAAELGIKTGDMVVVESVNGRLVVGAVVRETSSPNVVAMPFGIGRTAYGRWASKTGTNVNEILAEEREYLSGSAGFFSTRVRVYKVVSG